MKKRFATLFFMLINFVLLNSVLFAQSTSKSLDAEKVNSQEYNAWLKQRFGEQHQKLIPVVAVADIFYACNIERRTDPIDYQLSDLILKVDKNQLAQKLALCLGDDKIKSDIALNFGLLGCFHEQLAHLPANEGQQKMHLVKTAIHSLSHDERQKSFSQCVTEQAIHYLK